MLVPDKHVVLFLFLISAFLATLDAADLVENSPANANLHHLQCLGDFYPGSGEKPADMIAALRLDANYKLVVRYTDHKLNTTAKVVESNFTDALRVDKEFEGVEETFIIADNQTVHYKGSECSTVDSRELHSVYNISDDLQSILNISGSDLAKIFDALARANYDKAHLDVDKISWIDGVNAVSWFGCINQTEKTAAVQVAISFVGTKSLKSYSDYNNPKVAALELIAYRVDNVTSPQNVSVLHRYSLSLVELEHTRARHRAEQTRAPRGVHCARMRQRRLPGALPRRFDAHLEYVDALSNRTDSATLMYDGASRVVAFALDLAADSDIPYVQQRADTSATTTIGGDAITTNTNKARVFLDFNTGFEYTLSKDGRVCQKVGPIQRTWQSVADVNGTLILRDPTRVFFNISRQPTYYAGQVVEEGVPYDLYVTKKTLDPKAGGGYIVVELLFTRAGWTDENGKGAPTIHSIVQYHRNTTHALTKKTVVRFNSLQNNTLVGTSWSRHSVFPCLIEGPSDNFFFLRLADVNMKTVQAYGYENVESALAEAVAKTANISVLRVSQFLLKTVNKELVACFLLGEKNNGTPAPVRDRLEEKSIDEVRAALNGTLQTQKINVAVVTDDLKEATITIVGLGVVNASAPDRPIPPMMGYSSGSMFILGIFAYIFGAGTAVGSYVFYTKRQAVRGIAYQVFE